MIQKTKHLVLALFILLSGTMIALPAMAAADTGQFKNDVCNGINTLNNTSGSTCPTNGGSTISNIFKLILNILSILVGFVAVVMIMVGGFKFITASGDASSIASARSTIVYALVGLVIAVMAQALVHFVLFRTSGAAVCKYNGSYAATDPKCVKPK